MKWIKIFAVGGTAFFTTIAGLLTVDGITGGEIPLSILIPTALVVAGIQSGLAICREISTEEIKEDLKKASCNLFFGCSLRKKINHALNHMLLW